jgi:predicted ArsR family transcriptional regulator
MSRDECAQASGISRSLAAYHLDKLLELGLLEAGYARPAGRKGPGAGRPAKLYRCARREFLVQTPARDYQLLAKLLAEVADWAGEETRAAIEESAREAGRRVGTAATAEPGQAPTPEELLRERGYEPFAAEPGIMRLRNCPFDEIAGRHPALVCGLNLALIEGLLAGLGSDPRSALLAPQKGSCCVAIRTG